MSSCKQESQLFKCKPRAKAWREYLICNISIPALVSRRSHTGNSHTDLGHCYLFAHCALVLTIDNCELCRCLSRGSFLFSFYLHLGDTFSAKPIPLSCWSAQGFPCFTCTECIDTGASGSAWAGDKTSPRGARKVYRKDHPGKYKTHLLGCSMMCDMSLACQDCGNLCPDGCACLTSSE